MYTVDKIEGYMKIVKSTIPTIVLFISFCASFFYSQCAVAQIYKWTDQQGNTRFSDIQPEQRDSQHVEEVNLSGKDKYNRMNASKKSLLEKVDNQELTSEVERKTEDYKKVRAHNADEDVSSKLQSHFSNAGTNSTNGSGTSNSTTNNSGNSGTNNSNSNFNTTDVNKNNENKPFGSQSTFRGSEEINTNNNQNNQQNNQQNNTNQNQDISPTSKLNIHSIKQAKNCATAQENFAKLTQNNSNNIIIEKNHKLKKLSSTELDNQIKEAKSQMAYFC